MGKLVVALDGVVIKEVPVEKERTTLGRRPYNDIVIDNLAVSGEHAALQVVGSDVFVEDLNSTNGTYVNGKAVKKQLLAHNDLVEIGKYKIRYLNESHADYEKTMILQPGAALPTGFGMVSGFGELSTPAVPAPPPAPAPAPVLSPAPTPEPTVQFPPGTAVIKVLDGAAAGREVPLQKVVTTVGKPGVQVASITKRPSGHVLSHIEGPDRPRVNGIPMDTPSVALSHGDVIELAGTRMQFQQH